MQSFLSSHAPDAAALALAIVDTVRESLLVLDKELRVLDAGRSFYLTFEVTQDETEASPAGSAAVREGCAAEGAQAPRRQ